MPLLEYRRWTAGRRPRISSSRATRRGRRSVRRAARRRSRAFSRRSPRRRRRRRAGLRRVDRVRWRPLRHAGRLRRGARVRAELKELEATMTRKAGLIFACGVVLTTGCTSMPRPVFTSIVSEQTVVHQVPRVIANVDPNGTQVRGVRLEFGGARDCSLPRPSPRARRRIPCRPPRCRARSSPGRR